jgi:hypothetical protein
LFHELHLHERTPILVGDPFLSGNEVHRQDVPILLRTALAFLIVPEQATISGSIRATPLVEEQRIFRKQLAREFMNGHGNGSLGGGWAAAVEVLCMNCSVLSFDSFMF